MTILVDEIDTIINKLKQNDYPFLCEKKKELTYCFVIFVSQKEFEKKLDDGDLIVRGVMAILSERLRDLQKRR